MHLYIIKRLLFVFPVLLGVLLMTFVIMQVAAGDQAKIYWRTHAGNQTPTKAQLEEIREELGLNDPLIIQFFRWSWDVFRLRLGQTTHTKQSVAEEMADRIPYTLALTAAAMISAVMIAVPLGILSAAFPHSLLDGVARIFSSSGICVPQFWLGLLLIYFFGFKLRWFPQFGSGTPLHLVLPAVTLAVGPAATLTRLIRANMLEVLTNDFVSTAYAKGLPRYRVVLKHIFRPALVPVVTMIGLQFGFIFGGAVVVETIFSWPGVGKWAVDGIFHRDMPVIRAFILMMGVIFVTANLIVDLVYMYIDPRIQQ
jgi:peptide/nickel transport system permease protein